MRPLNYLFLGVTILITAPFELSAQSKNELKEFKKYQASVEYCAYRKKVPKYIIQDAKAKRRKKGNPFTLDNRIRRANARANRMLDAKI